MLYQIPNTIADQSKVLRTTLATWKMNGSLTTTFVEDQEPKNWTS